MKRYRYRTMPEAYRDLDDWPPFSTEAMMPEERARFERLELGIRTYLERGRLKRAATAAGCSPSELVRRLNRCLSPVDNGGIVGWVGLLRGESLTSYRRVAALPDGRQASGAGAAGSFRKFLEDHPALHDELDQLIIRGRHGKPALDPRPRVTRLYGAFKRLCTKHGIDETQYPLNYADKGHRSLERYVKAFRVGHLSQTARRWSGPNAADRLRLGTGKESFVFTEAPLDVAQLDAHDTGLTGTVRVRGPTGPQRVVIERLWIYAAICPESRAILGYAIGIRTEPNAELLEEALAAACTRWQPRALRVEGLAYSPGSGLPAGLIPGLDECRPAVLQIDNAAAHFAQRIAEKARQHLGCAVTYGAVGAWWRNAIVERLWQTLQLYGFEALPSSTGRGACDELRPDCARQAIANCIDGEDLLDVIEVIVTGYNARKHRGTGGRSPLSVLAERLAMPAPDYLPRLAAPSTLCVPALGTTVERRTVQGSIGRDGRTPYVHYAGADYYGPELAARYDLLRSQVVLHLKKDIRNAEVFLPSGEYLGTVTVERKWRRSAHTLEIRRAVNRMKLDVSDDQDAVAAYMDALAAAAVRETSRNRNKTSRSGTKLAAAANVSGLPTERQAAETLPESPAPHRPVPEHVLKLVWRSS